MDSAEREGKSVKKNRKEAAERLRQLINSNFKNDEVEISVSYDICFSKTETMQPDSGSRS